MSHFFTGRRKPLGWRRAVWRRNRWRPSVTSGRHSCPGRSRAHRSSGERGMSGDHSGGPMTRFLSTSLITAGVVFAASSPLAAQSKPPGPASAGVQRIAVCKLLTAAEVKKHLPWRPLLDQFPPEEEAIGTSGSSCNYPSVMIQVLPFSQGMIDAAKKKGGLETVSGIGEEAYFHNNLNRYAELYVKSGKYLLTLQSNWDGKDP